MLSLSCVLLCRGVVNCVAICFVFSGVVCVLAILEGDTIAFFVCWGVFVCVLAILEGKTIVFFCCFGLCILDSLEHLLKSGPGRLSDSFGFKIVLKSYRGARKTTMEVKKIDLGRF